MDKFTGNLTGRVWDAENINVTQSQAVILQLGVLHFPQSDVSANDWPQAVEFHLLSVVSFEVKTQNARL